MKKLLSLALCVLLFVSCFAISANAEESVSKSVEYLADGSYFVTEVMETNSLARTAKSGTKVSTYYTSDDVRVFAVKLTGYFDYTYGSSATATNQSVSVVLYEDEASLRCIRIRLRYGFLSGLYYGSIGKADLRHLR